MFRKIGLIILVVMMLLPVSVSAKSVPGSTNDVFVGDPGYGLRDTGSRLGYQVVIANQVSIYTRINSVVSIALGLIGLIFFAMMLYAGLRWLTARGNEEYVGKAKTALEAAIIGLVVVMASYGISNFVLGKLGTTAGGGLSQGTLLGCCSFADTNYDMNCYTSTKNDCEAAGHGWNESSCEQDSSCKANLDKGLNFDEVLLEADLGGGCCINITNAGTICDAVSGRDMCVDGTYAPGSCPASGCSAYGGDGKELDAGPGCCIFAEGTSKQSCDSNVEKNVCEWAAGGSDFHWIAGECPSLTCYGPAINPNNPDPYITNQRNNGI